MSASDLNAFLIKLHDELSKDSDHYRKHVTDKIRHVFNYRSSHIRKAIKVVLQEATGEQMVYTNKKFKEPFDKKLTKLTETLRTNFEKAHNPLEGIVVNTKIRGGVSAVFTEFHYISGKNKGQSRSNYNAILALYKDDLNDFYKEVLEILNPGKGTTNKKGEYKPQPLERVSSSSKTGTSSMGSQSDVFNLGHEKLSNIEHFLNAGIHNALNEIFTDTKLPPELKTELKQKFPELGEDAYKAILKVYKNAQAGQVDVSIESRLLNARKGGSKEQQLSRDLKAILLKMDVPNLDGSDSLVRAHRKKLVKAIADPYLKMKGLKRVKIEDTTIKESGSRSISHDIKTKNSKRKGSFGSKQTLRKKKEAKQTAPSLASILGFLNMKLPDVVAGNMGDPRLNYRTGRFSQSVRATDVSQTAQGFPSIGYTYDKSKYGQFESTSGTRFADADRDPRPLIDASIREIVMQLGMGRIYTRRQ